MNIQIKATNIDLTDSVRNHIDIRVASLEKYIDSKDTSVSCQVEVERTTEHHKSGEIYRAEINIHIAGHDFRSVAIKENLFDAIDEMRNQMARELRGNKGKTQNIRKGGLKIKEFLRGLRKK